MTKSVACRGFCEQLYFKNTCFGFCCCCFLNIVSMDAKIIFDLDSSFGFKIFLTLTTSQIGLLEGAVAACGITGNKKAFLFLMVSFYSTV